MSQNSSCLLLERPSACRSLLRCSVLALSLWTAACTDEEAALKVGVPEQPRAENQAAAPGAGLQPGPPGNPEPQGATNPGSLAVPQEELARHPEAAMKITGTLTITGASSGLLQIDVLGASAEGGMGHGTAPLTVARFKSPGPYELYVPLKVEKAFLVLTLDLRGDGPDSGDPRAVYEKNPLLVSKEGASGVDFALDATQPPPGVPVDIFKQGTADAVTDAAPANPTDQAGAQPPGGASASQPSGVAPAGTSPGTPAAPASTAAAAPPSSAKPASTAPASTVPVSTVPVSTAPASKAPASTVSSSTAPSATAPTVKAPTLSAAPAPSSVPMTDKPQARPSTAGAKPATADGRPVMDVLDESLDGVPKRSH